MVSLAFRAYSTAQGWCQGLRSSPGTFRVHSPWHTGLFRTNGLALRSPWWASGGFRLSLSFREDSFPIPKDLEVQTFGNGEATTPHHTPASVRTRGCLPLIAQSRCRPCPEVAEVLLKDVSDLNEVAWIWGHHTRLSYWPSWSCLMSLMCLLLEALNFLKPSKQQDLDSQKNRFSGSDMQGLHGHSWTNMSKIV